MHKSRILHKNQAIVQSPLFSCRNDVHNEAMTELLEKALAAARVLPPVVQDDIARTMLRLAGEEPGPVPLTAEEKTAIAASKAAAARGEFATDEEVRALWASYGL